MTKKVTYPVDHTGVLAGNRIENEIHTTTVFNDRSFHLIVPFWGPFFEDGLVLVRKIGLTTQVMTPGADYSVAMPHMLSPTNSGKKIYTAIVIHDTSASATFDVTYQTYGGSFSFDQAYIIQKVAQKVYGDKDYNWAQVQDKPEVFPTANHNHDFDVVRGFTDLIAALDSIVLNLESSIGGSAPSRTYTGDLTGSGGNNVVLTLSNTTVVPGTYNKATVDAKGRVTLGDTVTSINDYDIPFTYIEEQKVIDDLAAAPIAPISHRGAGGAQHAVVTTTTAGFMSAADKAMLDNAPSLPISNAAPENLGTAAAGTQNVLSRIDHVHNLPGAATTTAAGLMSAADKTKLNGIEAGAQVNTIFDVNGMVGDVVFDKDDFGLDQVDNTADLDKPISAAMQTALDAKQDVYVVFTLEEDDILALDPAAYAGECYKATDTLIEYVSDGVKWVNPLDSGSSSVDAAIVRVPAPLYPLQGNTGVSTTPVLSGYAFSPLYVSDVRVQREFELTLAADTSFATPLFKNSVNANSISITAALSNNTQYIWRCRDAAVTNSGIAFSDWSAPQSFTTLNIVIATPTFTSIEGSPNSVPGNPAIVTSAFSISPAGAETHISTTWLVMNSSGTVLYTNANDTVNLTSWTIPDGVLSANTDYKFAVRYNSTNFTSDTAVQDVRTLAVFPYDNYLAVAHDSSPFITIYGKGGDTFIKLANPSALPSDLGTGASFSQDGVYLAHLQFSSPYINIYKRSGDTFTRLANPTGGLPVNDTGVVEGVHFSYDGTYLAAAHDSSPFITIYKRSGDTFTKLANPSVLPPSRNNGCAFSPDGTYLAVAHNGSPFITIYKRSGDTFTKLADPSGGFPGGDGLDCSFSPDGIYLAVSSWGFSQRITIYKRSGDTFTRLANPSVSTTGSSYGCSFSPDGNYLAVAHSSSPRITIYKRSGDTFTKLADPSALPGSDGRGCEFSPDGTYLAVAHDTTPFITIYKRSGDTFTKLANPSVLPTGIGRRVSWFLKGFGATK